MIEHLESANRTVQMNNVVKYINQKSGNCDALQFKTPDDTPVMWALITRPIMQLHRPTNSTIPQGLFRQSICIYRCCWPNLYCGCTETTKSKLTLKTLDNVIGFCNPDFLHNMESVAMGGHLMHDCDRDLWPFDVEHLKCIPPEKIGRDRQNCRVRVSWCLWSYGQTSGIHLTDGCCAVSQIRSPIKSNNIKSTAVTSQGQYWIE